MRRNKENIKRQGLWLAKAMFQGPGQSKRKFPHGPVSGGTGKDNQMQLKEPEIAEKIKNG
jgi:hypothetical protein